MQTKFPAVAHFYRQNLHMTGFENTNSERPESSSERVNIAWLGVRILIPSVRSVLRTRPNFRIRPLQLRSFERFSVRPTVWTWRTVHTAHACAEILWMVRWIICLILDERIQLDIWSTTDEWKTFRLTACKFTQIPANFLKTLQKRSFWTPSN